MKLIVSGRGIELASLNGPLDQAFLDLYAAYFGGQSVNWSGFLGAAEAFFSTLPAKTPKHNDYFNNFGGIWTSHLNSGRFDEAERIWKMALEPALHWETANGSKIHKGTPYYFWGATAVLHGDLDKGFALMHQALEEDKRTVGSPGYLNEPAYAFASLDFQQPNQAFKQWIDQQARFLEDLINKYALVHGGKFALNDFRAKFLVAPPSNEVLFLFTYSLARLKHFCDLPDYIISSEFASMLQINILSNLTVILEDVLESKNPQKFRPQKNPKKKPQKCTFIDHAEHLLKAVGQPLGLGEVNGRFEKNFESTLLDILSGTFRLGDGSALTGHQAELQVVVDLVLIGEIGPAEDERVVEVGRGGRGRLEGARTGIGQEIPVVEIDRRGKGLGRRRRRLGKHVR